MKPKQIKQDESRFTIRFNPNYPSHQKAMELLNMLGRSKAYLIAEAVCAYAESNNITDIKTKYEKCNQRSHAPTVEVEFDWISLVVEEDSRIRINESESKMLSTGKTSEYGQRLDGAVLC